MDLPDSAVRMDFVLLHCEIQGPGDFNDDVQTNPFKLIQRQLRVHLRPAKGSLTRSAIDALRTFDEAFTQEYPEVKRGLLCKECRDEDVNSIALLDEEFQLREYEEHCNTLEQHEVEDHLKTLFSVPGNWSNLETQNRLNISMHLLLEKMNKSKQVVKKISTCDPNLWRFRFSGRKGPLCQKSDIVCTI